MLIDLHVHETTYSPCGKMTLREIVGEAREKGLDAVCITDHDSMGLCDTAHAYSREAGFPVFIGVEIFTLEGDMIVFGLDEAPQARPGVRQLLRTVRDRGGYCFAAHPFRDNGRGLGENLRLLRGFSDVAGIEVLNGNTDAAANEKALKYCREMGLQAFGCSDAHRPGEVGVYATEVPGLVTNEAALVLALRAGGCRPRIRTGAGYIPIPDNV